MSWMNEENTSRTSPPEHWTHFSVERMDPKTHTFSSIYINYSFRLMVTRPSGECSFSPAVSVFTNREPFSGKNLHQALNRENEQELTTVLQSG
ncbi:hypothetical protein PO909_011888 [Leuciscus waleckii]